MPLSDDIRALRDQILADLTSAHDYYTNTKIAWRIVHNVIASGQRFAIRNMTTGTVTTQVELGASARGYVNGQLPEATFNSFRSLRTFTSTCSAFG